MSIATPGGSTSMKSFFGPVLEGAPMLHGQIRPKYVYFQGINSVLNNLQAHGFSRTQTQIPIYFAVHGLADMSVT